MAGTTRWIPQVVPTWLQSYFGERLLGAVALMADGTMSAAVSAVSSAWLHTLGSPEDAAEELAIERGLPRYPDETTDEHRNRLLDAWSIWGRSGGQAEIRAQLTLLVNATLRALGLPEATNVKVFTPWTWAREWPSNTVNWSRFWVVLEGSPYTWASWGVPATAPFPGLWGVGNWGAITWGAATTSTASWDWGNGLTWGLTPNHDADLRGVVERHRQARWICPEIIVTSPNVEVWGAGQPWDPSRSWLRFHPARI